jgi:hypothetical protein
MIRAIVEGLLSALRGLSKLYGAQFDRATELALHQTTDDITQTDKSVVHVDTGTLKTSLGSQYGVGRNMDAVVIQPGFVNPKHGLESVVYGPIEEQRGGSHAFMAITYSLERPRAGMRFYSHLLRSLP